MPEQVGQTSAITDSGSVSDPSARGQRIELGCIATKRSGHHAFLEWVTNHRPGHFAYFNNVSLKGAGVGAGSQFASSDERITRETTDDPSIGTLLFSYENHTLYEVVSSPSFMAGRPFAGPRTAITCLVVRDPINALASILKVLEVNPGKAEDHEKWIGRFVSAWLSHAAEFLGRTHVLEAPLLVSYNLFVRDAAYRRSLAERLDLAGTELIGRLSRFGKGGNTFFSDRRSYAPTPEALESRWRQLVSPDRLAAALRDPEFRETSEAFYRAIGLWPAFEPVMDALARGRSAPA